MTTSGDNFLLLLLVSNAILLGIACLAVARFDRRCQRVEEFWASPTGTALSNGKTDERPEYLRITQRLEERVGELQRTVKVMEIKTPQTRRPEERVLPIENAMRMAKLGASVEDLTRSCGLNVGEARLMRKLHGQARLAIGE
jgi:hypothetical protein